MTPPVPVATAAGAATRRVVAILALLGTLAAQAAAQNVPRRPRLAADVDTNDARAYFQLGTERVERNPGQAADAFYWASRLDPSSPQTLYALAIARLLRDPALLVRYRERDPRTLASPAARALDSLRFRAEMQDPFFHRGMDQVMLYAYARSAVRREEWFGRSEDFGRTGMVQFIERFFEETDPYGRGQLYYSDHRLSQALQYWALALRNRRGQAWLIADRARAWAELGQLDSARVALDTAIHFAGRAGADHIGHVFESRAAWLHALGRIHEDRRDTAAAAAAYHRAVEADAAYYPARFRLGALAVLARDPPTAIEYLSRATSGPDVQFFALAAAAALYSQLGRRDSTVALLQRATQTEPWASAGWLMYAQALDAVRDSVQALPAYERYLALAPRNDVGAPAATRRVQQLRAAAGQP